MFCKHPDIEICMDIMGPEGNAYVLLGTVEKALKKFGHDEDAKSYIKEAMSGDYENLLAVTRTYVSFEDM